MNEQDLKEFNEELQKMIIIQDEAIARYWNALNEIEKECNNSEQDSIEFKQNILKIIEKVKDKEEKQKVSGKFDN